MRRSLVVMPVMMLGLLLAACAPAGTPAPAPTQPSANGDSGVQATNVPQAKATEPVAAASTPTAASTPAAVNTPEVTQPAATPDLEKVIKAQPDDWKRGPDGAKVTIIEWGDFQ
jgi:hypothetical protein